MVKLTKAQSSLGYHHKLNVFISICCLNCICFEIYQCYMHWISRNIIDEGLKLNCNYMSEMSKCNTGPPYWVLHLTFLCSFACRVHYSIGSKIQKLILQSHATGYGTCFLISCIRATNCCIICVVREKYQCYMQQISLDLTSGPLGPHQIIN